MYFTETSPFLLRTAPWTVRYICIHYNTVFERLDTVCILQESAILLCTTRLSATFQYLTSKVLHYFLKLGSPLTLFASFSNLHCQGRLIVEAKKLERREIVKKKRGDDASMERRRVYKASGITNETD